METWAGLEVDEIGGISYCGVIDGVDVVGCAEKEVWIVLCREVSVEIPTCCGVEIDA